MPNGRNHGLMDFTIQEIEHAVRVLEHGGLLVGQELRERDARIQYEPQRSLPPRKRDSFSSRMMLAPFFGLGGLARTSAEIFLNASADPLRNTAVSPVRST